MSAYRSSAPPTLAGATIYLGVVTVNTSDVPTAADTAPTCVMYAAADLLAKANPITVSAATAVTGETGVYVISKSSAGLAVGNYVALVAYALSAAARRQIIEFQIA